MNANKPRRNHAKTGGVNIGGNVSVNNGDFVAGDKNISLDNGSVYVSGDVKKGDIITGDEANFSKTIVVREKIFKDIFKKIDTRPDTLPDDRDDLRTNVGEIKAEAEKGDEADKTFLARRLRNIKRMAPDILEVVIAAIANPAAGFAIVIKKIAEQVKASADNSEAKA